MAISTHRLAIAAASVALAMPLPASAAETFNGGKPQHLSSEALSFRTAHGVRRFKVEAARTREEEAIGLMYRRTMAADQGMVFEFPGHEPVSFYMANTLIPLDIIYVGPDARVISIARAKPLDETPLPSGGPTRAVVEINGGLAEKLGIVPGDMMVDRRIFPHG